MKRRDFIKYSTATSAWLLAQGLPARGWHKEETVKLCILHTNDVHSRIDPFPMDGSRLAGTGGVSGRATLIKQIKASEKNVLLLDAGDMFQGTPYFNLYQGEVEIKAMTAMGYDAGTIGNHDFDGGMELLKKQITEHARFALVNSNYNLKHTPLKDIVTNYIVRNVDGIRVGIYGLGIEMQGLIPKSLSGEAEYLDPVKKGNEIASFLKNEIKCDYIICLSHLGYQYKEQKISDTSLAPLLSHTDLIIGGHTHTFLDKAIITKNKEGNPLIINQVGWAGVMLGRMDVVFERNNAKNKCNICKNEWVAG
jgi:5'-nucleotidase